MGSGGHAVCPSALPSAQVRREQQGGQLSKPSAQALSLPPHIGLWVPLAQVAHCVSSVSLGTETGLRNENVYFFHRVDAQVNNVIPISGSHALPSSLQESIRRYPSGHITHETTRSRDRARASPPASCHHEAHHCLRLVTLTLFCRPGKYPIPSQPQQLSQRCPGKGQLSTSSARLLGEPGNTDFQPGSRVWQTSPS